MKANECFYCLNHVREGRLTATGWAHKCKFGISNSGLEDIQSCPKWEPNWGFQIGGYYTHMTFDFDAEKPNSCMEWRIFSDGEFPSDDPRVVLHICDFRQIERFVKHWGDYLRKVGAVSDEDE